MSENPANTPNQPADERPPKWREDFPVESHFDDYVTRRDFMRFLTLVSAGLFVGSGYTLLKALEPEETEFPRINVVRIDELQPASWKVFRYPDDDTPAILVRKSDGEYVAFHQKCTHLQCPVTYRPPRNGQGEYLSCHCHNARFDVASGRGTHGPPLELRPLRGIELREHDGHIVAVRMMPRDTN